MNKSLGYGVLAVLIPISFPVPAQEGGGQASLVISTGVAMAPLYQGAKVYSAVPLYDLQAEYENPTWGSFGVGLGGAQWQLPLPEPIGVKVLLAYDAGRDEKISTLGSDNTRLQGMGDLDGAFEAGLELSYQVAPFRAYVKGMQAAKNRRYGGEDLGKTAYVDLGIATQYALSDQLAWVTDLSTTWANSGYQRGYFGVTSQQANNTTFGVYRPGSGFKQVSLNSTLSYQWTSAVAFQGGVGVYTLLGDAADSPIVEKQVAGIAFMSASYRF